MRCAMTRKFARVLVSLVLTGIALYAVPGTAWASAIDISTLLTNPSFEGGVDGSGCPNGWTCSGSPGTGFGAYIPGASQFTPVADGIPGFVPDGSHAAFSPTGLAGSGGLKQVTSSTWASGNT